MTFITFHQNTLKNEYSKIWREKNSAHKSYLESHRAISASHMETTTGIFRKLLHAPLSPLFSSYPSHFELPLVLIYFGTSGDRRRCTDCRHLGILGEYLSIGIYFIHVNRFELKYVWCGFHSLFPFKSWASCRFSLWYIGIWDISIIIWHTT